LVQQRLDLLIPTVWVKRKEWLIQGNVEHTSTPLLRLNGFIVKVCEETQPGVRGYNPARPRQWLTQPERHFDIGLLYRTITVSAIVLNDLVDTPIVNR